MVPSDGRALRRRRPGRPGGRHHRAGPHRRRRPRASCGSSSSWACSSSRCRRRRTRAAARVGRRTGRSAREAVAASAVLLKTTPGVLPIAGHGRRPARRVAARTTSACSRAAGRSRGRGATAPITPGTTIADALADRLGDRARRVDPTGAVRRPARAPGSGSWSSPSRRTPRAVGDSGDARACRRRTSTSWPRVRPLVDRLVVVVLSGRPVMLDEVLPDRRRRRRRRGCRARRAPASSTSCSATCPFGATTPYTWPTTPDDAPRTGKDACDGAVFPIGYGLDAEGELLGTAPCSEP